jgi:GH25 family lysozyme M1 (1,4-beta-N-acetylmuramidase)
VDHPLTTAVAPWGKWTFWQYSSTGDGLAYGMESRGLDMDWFNGMEDELRVFANVGAPVPYVTDAEKLKRLWEAHKELH